MHPQDKEETTFMMVDANYYYEVLSFDLKNTGVSLPVAYGQDLPRSDRSLCGGLCG